MAANTITLLRMPLLAFIVGLLYLPSATPRFVAAGLILLLILMDMLDGLVARAMHQASVLGSVLDIAADRTVELVLWVVFAHLNLISVVVPLIVLARGVFVDAIRAVAPSRGLAPFDLLRSQLGRFLVKSPWLRTPYGVVKAVAFFLLAVQHGYAATDAVSPGLVVAALAATWLAVAFSLLRGLPVLIEGPGVLANLERKIPKEEHPH